jgi:glycosyltransferase involved in cell wall biosynthesis
MEANFIRPLLTDPRQEFKMKRLISIIIPAYNEEEVIEALFDRICNLTGELPGFRFEMIFVNDGSKDKTLQVIEGLAERDSRVACVDLSRNFGKEIAMTAGLDHSKGDAVVVIDADLQDPPELIKVLVEEWNKGYDVVYARRARRDGETWLKKITASGFYRVMDKLSQVPIPRDTGDYRLMSRRAVDSLVQLRERHRFMKGLFAWVGFPSKAVYYYRDSRMAGTTKFNYWKLWNFAIEGITSFTIGPLKLATYFGILISLLAFGSGIWVIFKTLFWGEPVRGYPSLMVTLLFLGGVQLFCIGVLGEYLGRIFDETKNRPLYFVQSYKPARNEALEPEVVNK